jgi:hypothetical protein
MGQAGVMASVGLGLGLAPGAVAACAIMVPECRTAGGIAYLHGSAGQVVMFTEDLSDGPRRTMLVECVSREGVMIVENPDAPDPFWEAQNRLETAMNDDTPQTLDQVLRQVRRTGVEAARVRLGESHCGCDLPAIEAPPTHCPEM